MVLQNHRLNHTTRVPEECIAGIERTIALQLFRRSGGSRTMDSRKRVEAVAPAGKLAEITVGPVAAVRDRTEMVSGQPKNIRPRHRRDRQPLGGSCPDRSRRRAVAFWAQLCQAKLTPAATHPVTTLGFAAGDSRTCQKSELSRNRAQPDSLRKSARAAETP